MRFIQAKPGEYQKIRSFYHSLIDALGGLEYSPAWRKDIYPAPEDIREAVDRGWLYYVMEDGRIAGAMVLNQKSNEAYNKVKWNVDAGPGQFMAVHMLGVHRDFTRQGMGKAMVRFLIDLARKNGMKAIRLDVWKGNLPAEKLYENSGFELITTIPMYYEDTGWTDFELYEYRVMTDSVR